MDQTSHFPFEDITVSELRKGLNFIPDSEEDPRTFLSRINARYQRDRHLIPVPVRIILDEELADIAEWGDEWGYSGPTFTRALCVPRMCMLVRQMMLMQSVPHLMPPSANPN